MNDSSIIIIDIDGPGPSTNFTTDPISTAATVGTTSTASGASTTIEPINSDDKPKRKRRNKDEIEAEKTEKEVKRIRREMNSAKNAKCEQFLFCYVDRSVCLLDDSIEQELRNRFVERAVADQIAFVDGDYGFGRIVWKRKRIDAIIEEGKVKSLQTMDPEGCFIHVLEGSAFTQLIKKKELQQFVENVANEHGHSRSLPNIVVFGQGGAHTTQTTTLSLKSFEHYRNQVRYCKTAVDFSYLVAQLHRAIAKSEKRMAQDDTVPVIELEKGIRDGMKTDLRLDWWTRMLSHVHRMSEEQKRAIVSRWPDPFVFMNDLIRKEPDEAIKSIADIVAGNNRRIGPAIAKTLYTFLTSKDGEDVIVE